MNCAQGKMRGSKKNFNKTVTTFPFIYVIIRSSAPANGVSKTTRCHSMTWHNSAIYVTWWRQKYISSVITLYWLSICNLPYLFAPSPVRISHGDHIESSDKLCAFAMNKYLASDGCCNCGYQDCYLCWHQRTISQNKERYLPHWTSRALSKEKFLQGALHRLGFPLEHQKKLLQKRSRTEL